MKKTNRSSKFMAAIACAQVLSGEPSQPSLQSLFKPTAVAQKAMPAPLAQAVAPLIDQGFYVMGWEVSPAGNGYMVDLYHSNPGRLGSQRDDIRGAAFRGQGINLRKYIPNKPF